MTSEIVLRSTCFSQRNYYTWQPEYMNQSGMESTTNKWLVADNSIFDERLQYCKEVKKNVSRRCGKWTAFASLKRNKLRIQTRIQSDSEFKAFSINLYTSKIHIHNYLILYAMCMKYTSSQTKQTYKILLWKNQSTFAEFVQTLTCNEQHHIIRVFFAEMRELAVHISSVNASAK